jgi:predicted choloylglycine hydrolase
MGESMQAQPPPAITFRAVDEESPGQKLRALYVKRADAYAAWYLSEGDLARPTIAESQLALSTHMPELMPVYETLVSDVAEADPMAARMFTFLRPPPALVSCSQGVWRDGDDGPLLVRNYDYAPELMDGLILRSRFLDRTVVGTADGLWGLCDGMNDRGLAVSLTFGGRAVVGDGFGMPLVIRYLLETCDSVDDARPILERLPYSQAYNLTLADNHGHVVTAYLGPDRAPSFRRIPIATNFQWVVESWDPLLAESTLAREWWLIRLLDDPDVDARAFSDAFLAAPLYSFSHAEGVGTVYTAAFEPGASTVTYRWPGHDWPLAIDDFREGEYSPVFPLPSVAPIPA